VILHVEVEVQQLLEVFQFVLYNRRHHCMLHLVSLRLASSLRMDRFLVVMANVFDIYFDQLYSRISNQYRIQSNNFSYPTRMPSSISVGETVSARSTTNLANCFTLIIYLASSLPSLIIFVQRATCSGCSLWRACLSAAKSHKAGGARPVSDSFMPDSSLTRFKIVWTSSSVCFIALSYGPAP